MRAWVLTTLLLLGCGDEAAKSGAADPTGGGGSTPTATMPDAGLPVYQCPAGELPLDDGGCLPPGIVPSDCAVGFEAVNDGCEPIRPAQPCGPGTMALLGETMCHPVAPCASGTFGDIPVEANTQFVDQSFGGASDGTLSAPWTKIQDGVNAAVDGALVAIAAGNYNEGVVVAGKLVRLWGVCPDLVEINGTTAPAVRLQHSGSEIHGIALTSAGHVALNVGNGATGVLADQMWLHDAELLGFDVEGGNPAAKMTRSLIENQGGIGAIAYGSDVVIEDTVIRNMQSSAGGWFGHGIRVLIDDANVQSNLELRRVIIDGAYRGGVDVVGSVAIIEDSVVTNVVPGQTDDELGCGICLFESPDKTVQSQLTVRGSHVSNAHAAGILLRNSNGSVSTTVVRNILEHPVEPVSMGILALRFEHDAPSHTDIRSVLVEQTRIYGISVFDADATVEAALIRDTETVADVILAGYPDVGGRGLGVETVFYPEQRATMAARGIRVERTHEVAIGAIGAVLTLESAYVADVAWRDTDMELGRGINIQVEQLMLTSPVADIRNVVLERASDHGIMIVEGQATIEGAHVVDTRFAGNGILGRGIGVQGYQWSAVRGEAHISRSLVEGAHVAGIFMAGADVVVENTILRGTLPRQLDGLWGDGIVGVPMPGPTYQPSTVELRNSIVEDNNRAGISAWGGSTDIASTWLACNPIDISGTPYEFTDSAPAEVRDLGGNSCLCGDTVHDCKVVSGTLSPPQPAAQ
jgi:hypothetical protein